MIHNAHLNLRALPELYHAARTIAAYVVPQEYGISAADKVGVGVQVTRRHRHYHRYHLHHRHLHLRSPSPPPIGVQIASTMLHKIHDDMLAGMATESHERERVHRIDTSALSGTESINTPQRHVRTRLYFTSESHIFSLFNVLRWGGEATDGVTSIFNDECRAKFDAMEPCYLTHLVFRVLLRRGADPESPNSYTVQVLVSPGVNQHLHKGVAPSVMWDGAREFGIPVDDDDDGEKDEDPYRRGDLPEELLSTEPMILSSRDDLTLADVDAFFSAMYDAKTEVSVRAAAPSRPAPRRRPDARTNSLLLTKAQMVPSRSLHLLREPAQTAGAPHLRHLRHVEQKQLAAAPLRERAPPAPRFGRRLPAAAAAPRRRPAEERRRRRRRRRVRPATRTRRAGATPSAATRARWARCRAISSCRRAPRSRGGRGTCATGPSRRAASSKIAVRKSSSQVFTE